jgi:O-antigen ligase
MLSKKNSFFHIFLHPSSTTRFYNKHLKKKIAAVISTCRKNTFLYLIISTFGFLFLLFFLNQNTKTLLAAWVILTTSHFIILKNTKIAIFLSYLTSTVIYAGKSYAIQIIGSQYLSLLHPDGVFQFITISISDILICVMFFILCREIFTKKKISFHLPSLTIIFLIIYIICFFVSALVFSKNQNLSLFYAIQNSGILVAVLYARQYVIKNKLFLLYIQPVFLGLLSFESIIAFLQFIKNSVVGSSLEILTEMTAQGSIGENPFRTRPMGTFWHANDFANWLLPMLFITFGYLYIAPTKKKPLTLLIASLGTAALVFTQSRSAWISFIVLFFPFLYIIERRLHHYLVIPNKIFFLFVSLGICCLITAMYVIPERFIQTIYMFEQNASGWSRIEQLKEWGNLIIQYPLFGVGQGMSLYEVFFSKLRERTDALYWLPTVAHNVYFIITSETGIISILSLFGYFYVTIRNAILALIINNEYSTIMQLSCLFGIIATAINYAFQPYNSSSQLILLSTIFLFTFKAPSFK